MSKENIIRAWKDPEYRASLSQAERAMLPENPAGLIELEERSLQEVNGGSYTCDWTSNTYVCTGCVSQGIHNAWNVAAPMKAFNVGVARMKD